MTICTYVTQIHQRLRTVARRFLQAAAVAAVALVICGLSSPRVDASCGDYLYRNGKPVSHQMTMSEIPSELRNLVAVNARDSQTPPSGCHGPGCSNNPFRGVPAPEAPPHLVRGADQAALLDMVGAPPWNGSGRIVPESERGARYAPSAVYRPPIA